MRRRIEYLLKHNMVLMHMFMRIGSLVFIFLGYLIKTEKKKVLFCSYSGKKYNDSPQKIYEYMLQDPRCKDLQFIWALCEPETVDIPGNCRKVKIDTLPYFILALKAKVWIANVNIERGLKFKKRNQFYLNTWHGTSVNWVGNAVKGRSDFKWDYIDAFCFSGEYERDFIKRDFMIKDDHLLPSGLPRNDDLYSVDKNRISKIRKKLDIPCDKKIILYAPTWRESDNAGASCNITPPISIDKWKTLLSQEYILIFRAHYNTEKMLGIKYDDFVRNGSDYPDVNDLMVIADFLITDYSCIMMDYSILEKPVIEFGYDYDEYSKMRGFYFDLDKEIPSHILRTEDEVLEYIKKADYLEECKKIRNFKQKYINYGGHATQMCVDCILNGIKK